jgi:2-methylcitrate dehydratase PrpD
MTQQADRPAAAATGNAQAAVSGGQAAEVPGLTAVIWRRCAELSYEQLPADVIMVAKQCLIDWLGVTMAGYQEPVAQIIRAEMAAQGGNPQAAVVGGPARMSAYQAAVVNGTTAHALDYDDVLESMLGHPSAPIYAAVLALAEAGQRSGRECLTAFVAGVEAASALGRLTSPSHYQRGFHTTGTIGSVGAAAACARLLGLDGAAGRTALGIGATQAAGLKAVFGTMSKPFHAGKAAGNGVLAASLAQRGMSSSPQIIEAYRGFAPTMSDGPYEAALDGWASAFDIRDILFKYHASCYHTHSAIEGMLSLRGGGLDPASVEHIELRVTPTLLGTCAIPEPATGLEGKFSLRFAAALALADGEASERCFTDAMVARPDLIALRDRVELIVDDTLTEEFATQVSVTTGQGARLIACVNVGLPAPGDGLGRQGERLAAKFRVLAGPRAGAAGCEEILDTVANLEAPGSAARLARLVAVDDPA